MKVAFDVACLSQSRAGTARVARGLLAGLAGFDGIEVVQIGNEAFRPRGSSAQRLSALRQDLSWYAAGRSVRAARSEDADVVHFPTYRGPVLRPTPPMVVTVLDLAVLREPKWFPPWARIHARTLLPRTVRVADRVIAISRQTADDVVTMLGVPASRVRVVECGIDAMSDPPGVIDEGRPYLLGVGTRSRARICHDSLKPSRSCAPETDVSALLLLVGADGWGAVRLPPQPGVELRGRVSDQHLRDL